MRLSRTAAYTLRALACLANAEPGRSTPARLLAEAARIPLPLLPKLLRPLVSARILHAVRGPGGGFRLARPAEQVSLLDVLELAERRLRWDMPLAQEKIQARAVLDRHVGAACDQAVKLVRARLRAVSIGDLLRAGDAV